MILENKTAQFKETSGRSIEFSAQLAAENVTANMKVLLDDAGITLTTKNDLVQFPRSTWLSEAVLKNTFVVVVAAYDFGQWAKKRKFDKKNPGQAFTDFESKPSSYSLTFKPAKLPPDVTAGHIAQQAKRTYLLAYFDEVENPTIVECPDCKSLMDVSPYPDSESLFCDNCSRVIGVPDDANRGICDACNYYTTLVEKKQHSGELGSITTSRICHPCRVSNTFWAFIFALAAAIGIGLLNFATLFFADRFFPILILFGIGSLIWSVFNLMRVIVYSAAQKATGGSPLSNATAMLKKGKTDEALGIIQNLEGDMTSNPGILMNLTRGLFNAGDFKKADQFADTLIANFPNFQLGYWEKVKTRAALGGDAVELTALSEEALAVASRNAVRSLARTRQLK